MLKVNGWMFLFLSFGVLSLELYDLHVHVVGFTVLKY